MGEALSVADCIRHEWEISQSGS